MPLNSLSKIRLNLPPKGSVTTEYKSFADAGKEDDKRESLISPEGNYPGFEVNHEDGPDGVTRFFVPASFNVSSS